MQLNLTGYIDTKYTYFAFYWRDKRACLSLLKLLKPMHFYAGCSMCFLEIKELWVYLL